MKIRFSKVQRETAQSATDQTETSVDVFVNGQIVATVRKFGRNWYTSDSPKLGEAADQDFSTLTEAKREIRKGIKNRNSEKVIHLKRKPGFPHDPWNEFRGYLVIKGKRGCWHVCFATTGFVLIPRRKTQAEAFELAGRIMDRVSWKHANKMGWFHDFQAYGPEKAFLQAAKTFDEAFE